MYVNHLNKDQIEEVQKDSHYLWGGGLSIEARLSKMMRMIDVYGPNQFHASGIVENGQVAASIKCYGIHLALGELKYHTLGIAAVFTKPDCRGKGYATKIVELACQNASNQGLDAALLFSDIDPEFYKKLGFIEFESYDCSIEVARLPKASPLTLRPSIPSDFSQVLSWYNQSWDSTTLHVARSPSQFCMFKERSQSFSEMIFQDGPQDIGYLCLGEKNNKTILDEMIIPPKYLIPAWATIRQILQSKNTSWIEGWFNPEIQLPETKSAFRKKCIPMVKPLSKNVEISGFELTQAHFSRIDHF